jgi:hypothetical protein
MGPIYDFGGGLAEVLTPRKTRNFFKYLMGATNALLPEKEAINGHSRKFTRESAANQLLCVGSGVTETRSIRPIVHEFSSDFPLDSQQTAASRFASLLNHYDCR